MGVLLNERSTGVVTIDAVLAQFDKLSGGLGGYTKTQKAWDHAVAYLRWCKQHEVEDPYLFMWLRFRILRNQRGSRVRPSLKGLPTPTLLPQYRTMVYDRQLTKQADTQRQREFVSVQTGHEAVRRVYLLGGKTELCLAQPNLSGGYHPYSRFCPRCPRANECAQALNAREGFDVVALRLGPGRSLPQEAIQASAV